MIIMRQKIKVFLKNAIKYFFIYLNYTFWKIFYFSKNKLIKKENIKETLIINLSFIGDLLATTPLIDVLVKENFSVSVCVLPSMKCLFEKNKNVRRIIVFEKEKILSQIKGKYDLAILIYPRNREIEEILKKSEIPYKISFCPYLPFSCLSIYNLLVIPMLDRVHKVRENLSLISSLVDLEKRDITPLNNSTKFFLSKKEISDFQKKFKKIKHYVVVSPGSRGKIRLKEKLIDERVLSEISDYIIENYGYRIVLTGMPNEKEICDRIIFFSKYKNRFINLAGNSSIRELVFLLKNSRLLISIDSGAVHLAATQKTKIIDVIKESQIRVWAPWLNKENFKLIIAKNDDFSTINFENLRIAVDDILGDNIHY